MTRSIIGFLVGAVIAIGVIGFAIPAHDPALNDSVPYLALCFVAGFTFPWIGAGVAYALPNGRK